MPKKTKTPYLLKRGSIYHVNFQIADPAVRKKLGKTRFTASLGTDSESKALSLSKLLLTGWRNQVARAKGEPPVGSEAALLRRQLTKTTDPQARAELEMLIADRVDDLRMVDYTGQFPDEPEAAAFLDEVYAKPTLDHAEEWMASLTVKPKTADMRKATLAELAAKFPNLSDITRPGIKRWATEMQAKGLKPQTIARKLSDCRGYWQWLETMQFVSEGPSPFSKLGIKASNGGSWAPFEPAQVAALLRGSESDPELHRLITLAAYSGARRGELVALHRGHVKADRFEIIDAKTTAGRRIVPIHSRAREAMAALVAGAGEDGRLFRGTGDQLGKSFARLCKRLGMDDERLVFHSIRKSCARGLQLAGVPLDQVQDLIGHERDHPVTMRYVGTHSFETLSAALEKLSYAVADAL